MWRKAIPTFRDLWRMLDFLIRVSKGTFKNLNWHVAQNYFGICDLWRMLDFLNVL